MWSVYCTYILQYCFYLEPYMYTDTYCSVYIYIPTPYKWIRKFCYSVTYSTHHPLEQQHYRLNNTFFTTTIRQLSAHCPSYPPPPIRHSLPPLLSAGLPYSSCTVQCTVHWFMHRNPFCWNIFLPVGTYTYPDLCGPSKELTVMPSLV